MSWFAGTRRAAAPPTDAELARECAAALEAPGSPAWSACVGRLGHVLGLEPRRAAAYRMRAAMYLALAATQPGDALDHARADAGLALSIDPSDARTAALHEAIVGARTPGLDEIRRWL